MTDATLRTALQMSEERFRLLAESLPDLVYRFRFRPVRRFEYVNPACQRLTGYQPADLYADPELGSELLGPFPEPLDGDARARTSGPQLLRWCRRGGAVLWGEHRASAIRDAAGEVIGVQGIVADVTERVLAERVAAAQARVLELVARDTALPLVQASALEVVETELPGTLAVLVEGGPLRSRVSAAPAVPEAVGTACPAALGSHLERLAVGSAGRRPAGGPDGVGGGAGGGCGLHELPGLPDALLDLAGRRAAGHVWVVPVQAADPGSWAHVVVIADRPASGERDLAVVRTTARLLSIAAERDRAQRALAHQAWHDGLTGLANRALAVSRLEQAIAAREAGPGTHTVAVLFCDLDRFKNLNDSLGHSAGDALLVAVAQRLRSAADQAALVARTGGDEFTVIHEGAGGPAGAVAAAQRLVRAMEKPFHVQGRRVYASMSVGVAVAERGSSAEALVRDADAAMYRAKDRGGRRVEMFDVFMQVRARERLELETGLHAAMAKGELRAVYQPQVLLSTGRLVGAEALLRWDHDGFLVPPSDFVPVAEETGLIVPIGAWVLQEACVAGARTAARRPGFRVAVNLSARQLADPELLDHVARALEVSGLPAPQLCLEVTETALMDDAPAAMATLRTLHDLGVTFAVDDFGTGWSSLLYLKRLPVSMLKIDSTFVRGLGGGGEDEAIVASTIQLGHALGRTVIGEGVETAAQHARLEELGCRLGQGFWFGKAGPVEDLLGEPRPPR